MRKAPLGRKFAAANKLRLLPAGYDFLPLQTASRQSPNRYPTIFVPFFGKIAYQTKSAFASKLASRIFLFGIPPRLTAFVAAIFPAFGTLHQTFACGGVPTRRVGSVGVGQTNDFRKHRASPRRPAAVILRSV